MHKAGVAFAGFDVAEDLIVGAVLLDDVDDMLEDGRLAVAFGHRAGRGVWAGRGEGADRFGLAVVFEDLAGCGRQARRRSAA